MTIGELARRTGVSPAVLRTWEARHGFPRPRRLTSGHRRYTEHDVPLVVAVLRRQEAGVRLEAAIAQVVAPVGPRGASVFAELRRRHPGLVPQRLRKSTLLAMSRAIEDECFAGADSAVLFGAFQRADAFRASAARWRELARVARSTIVFAEFEAEATGGERLGLVPLPEDAPMRREWSVVVDGTGLPACLSAWEVPGQDEAADRDRVYETVWSLDSRVVREATRVCVGLAAAAGHATAGSLLEWLDAGEFPPEDLARATALFNRVVGYVDATRGPR